MCRISSSPRVDYDSSQDKTCGQEIRYQRIIRWDDALILSRTRGGDPNSDEIKRENNVPLRSRNQAAQTTSSSFRSCERGQDQFSVRHKQSVVAPPPGHYDVSYDIVSKRRDILGQINPVDRPNAPSYVYRSTRAEQDGKETCLGLLQTGKTSVVLAVDSLRYQGVSPRSALKRIRSTSNRTVLSNDQFAANAQRNDKGSTATRDVDLSAEEMGKPREIENRERQIRKKRGISVAEKDARCWLFPSKTMAIESRVPRYRCSHTSSLERSTATGYFSEPAWRCPDVWYRPNFETLPILQRHVHTPNLHHGGRDSDQHIQRLGFRRPEDVGHENPAAVSHRDWIPNSKLAGRGKGKIRGPFFDKLTGREPARKLGMLMMGICEK